MGRFDLTPEQITEGSISRSLLLLAAPLLAQNMVRVAQQVIDLFWVGRYSGDAVAAVGLATPVVSFLLASTISSTFIGTQVLVSQRVGAEDQRGARRAAFTGLISTIALGVGVGGFMYLNMGTLIDLVTATRPESVGGDVPTLATRYLEIIALGIAFAGMGDVVEAAFLGRGDSRAALYMNVVAVVGNVGLDPVFIFGLGPIPGMGIRGAALATVAGYLAGFLVGCALVVRGRAGGVYSWAAASVDVEEIRELLDIGLPRAAQGAATNSAGLVMVVVVYSLAGTAGLTAYTVGTRVNSLAARFVNALSQAAQSIVGQNLGAGKPERAASVTWTGVAFGVGGLAVVGLAQWFAPGPITHVFVPELTGRPFALTVTFLQIVALGYPAKAVLALMMAGFSGARRTKTPMVASITRAWGLQIPMAVVGGVVLGFGVLGAFWARTLSLVVAAVCLAGYYVRETDGGMYDRAAERVESAPGD